MTDISLWTWYSDRIDFKKSNKDFINLTCKKCKQTDRYNIDNVKAKESNTAQIIALSIFLIGTPVLLIFLWDYIFKINNIYAILILILPLIVPSLIYSIIIKNDRQRVRLFNVS
jgi:hypothetical protein